MQSLDYKLKTSNTNYVTARHDVHIFPVSSFFPAFSDQRHVAVHNLLKGREYNHSWTPPAVHRACPHNPVKEPRSTFTFSRSCGDLRHGAQHRHRPRAGTSSFIQASRQSDWLGSP